MTNETNKLKTYTMQQLYAQPLEPVEYLVDGLLAPGLYILGGSPKVGKSWMALQLCLAVCGGTAFLGRKTTQTEVLYLALEDGPQRLHSRALRLADTAPEGLYLCHRAAPIGQGLEQQIEAQLAEHPHIRLVVLDTLQKVRCESGSGLSYRRMLEAMYPTIGGLPLCKIRPMVLEELCEELRQRPGRGGKTMSENTIHKYLDTISAVLQDAVKNDILLYNPAHRVDKLRVERTPQRIPQAWEMQKLLQCILQEPLLYRVYYLLALSTGLRRGELCALRWRDLHEGNQLLIQHSRSTVVGKGVIGRMRTEAMSAPLLRGRRACPSIPGPVQRGLFTPMRPTRKREAQEKPGEVTGL